EHEKMRARLQPLFHFPTQAVASANFPFVEPHIDTARHHAFGERTRERFMILRRMREIKPRNFSQGFCARHFDIQSLWLSGIGKRQLALYRTLREHLQSSNF